MTVTFSPALKWLSGACSHTAFCCFLLHTTTMPVASSSRRKTNGRTNRQPSSDGIEEDQPTQHRGQDEEVDDDEDEDEQPVRSARVKKEKLSKGKRPDPKEPAGDEEDDDEDRIDVENFKDQPLAREDASKVAGIIKDWEMIRKQSQSGAGGWMEGIGVSMADLMDEKEAKKVGRSVGLPQIVTFPLTVRIVLGRT